LEMSDGPSWPRRGARKPYGNTRAAVLLAAALALVPACEDKPGRSPSAVVTGARVEHEPAAETAPSRAEPAATKNTAAARPAPAGTCTTPDTCYESAHASLNAGDAKKARRFFQKACDGEHGPACFQLGLMYRDGNGVRADDDQARQWFEQACRAGSDPGCDALGH
jgi:TPR repeat protein